MVRDCLTSTAEVAARAAGRVAVPSLRRDAARVDAVVSTSAWRCASRGRELSFSRSLPHSRLTLPN